MKINNFTILEIGRKKGASAKLTSGLSDITVQKLLFDALPLGNPETEVFKIITIEKESYLSFLQLSEKEDYGLALVISLGNGLTKLNPFGFIDEMKKFLLQHVDDHGENLPKTLDLDYNKPDVELDEYKNFDAFIFSLLTQQKTLVIGEKDELRLFLAGLYEFVPTELKRYLTLIGNSSNFTNGVFLHAIPVSKEVLKFIDEKRGNHTILFLPTNMAYGRFTSPICEKIISLQKNKEEDEIEKVLLNLFGIATESNDLPSIADFAAENKVSLADASLILWIRANHFDLEVPKGILEFTN
jgi:hypothetical protein